VVGETPNLAARLQALAEPDTMLVSDATHRLIQHRFNCASIGPVDVKGFDQPLDVYQANSESSVSSLSADITQAHLTPLVGRTREIGILDELWSQTLQNNGRTVFVQGEAGIGKSRLVAEIADRVDPASGYLLASRCSPYLTHSALHPIFELFRELLDLSVDDTESSMLVKLESILDPEISQKEKIRDFATTLFCAQQIGSHESTQKAQTGSLPFDAIVSLVLALSEDKPVLFILEDLHWVDPSTMEFLSLLINQMPLVRILIIVTARPEFRPEWMLRSHATQLTLDRLSDSDAEDIVRARTAGLGLSVEVRKALVENSDGVPLFIEELTQSVIEHQKAIEPTIKSDFPRKSERLEIPVTLRDSLMARLDRMGGAKVVAQFASAIGRQFSYSMLVAVANAKETDLRSALESLVEAELFYQRGVPPNAEYVFKHSLIQGIAYESLLNSKRVEYHGRIANKIVEEFPEQIHTHPELIARHYTLGANPERAVHYWKLASEQNLQRAAYVEAAHHAQEGLRLVDRLEPGAYREETELSLYMDLGAALSATQGYATADVEKAFQNALKISERLSIGATPFDLLRGMHTVFLIRGPLGRAVELGEKMLAIAEREGHTANLIKATRCLGWTHCCQGNWSYGQGLIRQSLSLYNKASTREYTRRNVSDPGGVGTVNLAWSEWFMGKVDTAVVHVNEAIQLARDIDHPFTLAYALCMSSAVYQCRRQPNAVLPLVDEAMEIASNGNYRYWTGWGSSMKGWALAQLDSPSAGIRLITDGLSIYRSTGARLFEPHILCMLSEQLNLQGKHDQAIELLDGAMRIEKDHECAFFSAETRRILGIVYASRGDEKIAREYLHESQKISRFQGAKSLELRAAFSLAQLFGRNGVGDSENVELRVLLDSLDEGNGTTEVKEAEGLLHQVSTQ